jgi:hypothetical protein
MTSTFIDLNLGWGGTPTSPKSASTFVDLGWGDAHRPKYCGTVVGCEECLTAFELAEQYGHHTGRAMTLLMREGCLVGPQDIAGECVYSMLEILFDTPADVSMVLASPSDRRVVREWRECYYAYRQGLSTSVLVQNVAAARASLRAYRNPSALQQLLIDLALTMPKYTCHEYLASVLRPCAPSEVYEFACTLGLPSLLRAVIAQGHEAPDEILDLALNGPGSIRHIFLREPASPSVHTAQILVNAGFGGLGRSAMDTAIRAGNVAACEFLINNNLGHQVVRRWYWHQYKSPIVAAAHHSEIVGLMLAAGGGYTRDLGIALATAVCGRHPTVELLARACDDSQARKALNEAVRRNDADAVQFIVTRFGPGPALGGATDASVLHPDNVVTELLLEHGATFSAQAISVLVDRTLTGEKPASESDEARVVRLAVEQNLARFDTLYEVHGVCLATINTMRRLGFTGRGSYHEAAANGRAWEAKRLKLAGVEATDRDLVLAAHNGPFELVQILVAAGARPTADAIDACAKNRHFMVLGYLTCLYTPPSTQTDS